MGVIELNNGRRSMGFFCIFYEHFVNCTDTKLLNVYIKCWFTLKLGCPSPAASQFLLCSKSS